MSKSIQSSFASRIGKAETLYNTLSGFADYSPGDESLMPHSLRVRIDSLYALQESHAARFNAFTAAVQRRQNLFKGEKALAKSMTMVRNYVIAMYGKESDKTRNVEAIVTKIRGEKPVKITTASGEVSISRSEKSYGAQHVNLLYLISTLSGFGNAYTPANAGITIDALTAFAQEIKAANDETVLAYQTLHPLVIQRQDAFSALSGLVQRIKQMVLSQYGNNSLEYRSIKGLDFRTTKS